MKRKYFSKLLSARFVNRLEEIEASYWFIPALLTFGALCLSFGTVSIDNYLGTSWIDGLDWLPANQPDGARALLSTIAGSMITVAGVTFSITIVAVLHASTQFGPRILTNFMRDRGNQITLGTFISTFVYCLMVLRTIQAIPPSTRNGVGLEPFVPHVSMLVAMLLTMASVAVFIYFLHHVPESVHVGHLVASLGSTVEARVEKLCKDFEEENGHDSVPTVEGFDEAASGACFVDQRGYIERIDFGLLVEEAKKRDAQIVLDRGQGAFLARQRPFAHVDPREALDDDFQKVLEKALVTGSQRSQSQSVIFLVDQLAEIAIRALSPGVNDPATAQNCMDWLGNVLILLGSSRTPDGLHRDDDGNIRVIDKPLDFERICEHVFGQLRTYLARDRNALIHCFETMVTIARSVELRERAEVLEEYARQLYEEAKPEVRSTGDLERIRQRLSAIIALCRGELESDELLESVEASVAGPLE